MAGVSFNRCEVIPYVVAESTYGEEAANFGESAAKLCSVATSDFANYGRKDCGGTQTPPLSWAGFSVTLLDLPAQFSFDLNFWLGVEETSAGKCLWAGADAGDRVGSVCAKLEQCIDTEVTYDALASMVNSMLDDLGEAAEDASAVDLAVGAFKVILALVVIVAIAAILSSGATAITVSGSTAAAALGGAALITSALA